MLDFDTPLEEINPVHCGQKFAVLHLLNSIKGIEVPQAVCITDRKFERAMLRKFHDRVDRIVVRSSASVEDSATGSAAGIFESYLNLGQFSDVCQAVDQCLTGNKTSRVRAYCRHRRISLSTINLAAIVQEYIPASVAGTAYTVNPLSGHPGLIVEKRSVNPAAPQVLVENAEMISGSPDNGNNPAWLTMLHSAIAKISTVIDGPLDIEWLWYQEQLYIVQCRPLLVKGAEPQAMKHLWTRGQIGEILPHPLTPLSLDIFSRIDRGATRRRYYSILDRAGQQFDKIPVNPGLSGDRLKIYDGHVYQNVQRLLSRLLVEPWTTAGNLQPGLGFMLPREADHRQLPVIDRMRRAANTILYLAELALPGLSLEKRVDGIIKAHLDRLQNKTKMNPLKREVMICRFLLGWQQAITGRILSHLGLIDRLSDWYQHELPSTGPITQAIAQIRTDPCFSELDQLKAQWQDFFAHTGSTSIGKGAQELKQDFYSRYRSFLERFGHRSANELELAQASWREDDRTLIDLLDTRQSQNSHEENPLGLLALPFRIVLKRLGIAVRARSSIKSCFVRHYRQIRHYYLQQAVSLKKQGKIIDEEDIFFLKYDEIENVIDLGPRELRHLLETRRRQYDRAFRQSPQFYRYRGVGRDENHNAKQAEVLTGIGCSSGIRTGRALVVTGFSQDIAVSPDEIIVANSADPGWTPLLMNAAGMITEIGGMLSHIATIARESHIPFVVNVAGGMQKIRNGQLITIDGYNGRVILEEDDSAPATSDRLAY